MVTEAVKKIKEEMSKNNSPYVQVIGAFLIQHVEANPGAAEKILNNEKSIIKSLAEMQREASKKRVGNCAVLTDQEGFEIVLKYYGISSKVTTKDASEVKLEPHTDKEVHSKPSINFDVKLDDFI